MSELLRDIRVVASSCLAESPAKEIVLCAVFVGEPWRIAGFELFLTPTVLCVLNT
ncbi:hypothetical protein L917_12966 [Phytophthora nicotianae]|uniref:Uncharacterized protein n=1 Tax=Phytophthora nicotianae TaxID=4792 RepID=W2KRV1_PHYNI|nr:hypothetical protein L916_13141 [Phytophthora nicotianae]ETL87926.1 hypothetical protein L917_12966 [Phytophthora nicotianae]